ncbi:MAG: phage minor head protein [Chlorobiaceae bacterium]
MERYLTTYLKRKGKAIAAEAVRLFEETSKAEDSDRAAELIAQLDINFEDLVPEMQDLLIETAREGVMAGAAQISLTAIGATKQANERAVEWAMDRAAELVGMKWVNGELVENPNAEWSISQSTREMIHGDVNRAIDEGWSNDRLADSLMENEAFSESRALMIARTETAFADIQGNLAAYEEAKAVIGEVKVEWITAQDDRVSDECEMNDGEVREIGEAFPSGATEPPQHPNCRCDLLPVIVGVE